MNLAKKVLIFDDNVDILELCTFILESAGYEIKTSVTTFDVEAQVQNFKPDLIFMDNWLPGLDGVQATKKIKKNASLKNIPVIYFSANNDISKLAKQAGADGYLSKPFDITTLEEIVRKYLK